MSGTGVGELALVIDRWDGLEPEYTGTLSMLAEKLYEIQMEYKDTFSHARCNVMKHGKKRRVQAKSVL